VQSAQREERSFFSISPWIKEVEVEWKAKLLQRKDKIDGWKVSQKKKELLLLLLPLTVTHSSPGLTG
jgi:hypothetical protein